MEDIPQQSPISPEIYEKEYERARARLLDIFKNKDNQEIEELCLEIRRFAEVIGWDTEIKITKIREAFAQEDPNVFVETLFNELKKLIDKKVEHPEIFEDVRREGIIQHHGNIKLSELMYYTIDLENGTAIIHIAPKGTLGLSEVVKAFREGIKELAKQVEKDERIKEIQATSWIVATNPGLLEKAGFEIMGEIDERMKAEHFREENRSVWWARISRKTLLERYLERN